VSEIAGGGHRPAESNYAVILSLSKGPLYWLAVPRTPVAGCAGGVYRC
jgi:hypothetical protein